MSEPYPVKMYGEEFYRNPGNFRVLAYIIDRCNYNCEYCCNRFPRSNDILDLFLLSGFIKETAEDRKPPHFYLDLIGGEPLLHPDLDAFMESVKEVSGLEVTIYSNLSFPVERYLDLLRKGFQFILSWHGICNDTEFFNKLKTIAEAGFADRVDVSVMLEPGVMRSEEMFIKIRDHLPKFKSLFLSSLSENGPYKRTYNQDELDSLDRLCPMDEKCNTKMVMSDGSVRGLNDNYFFLHPENTNFRWWMCNAGLDYVYVHHNGDVHPCDSMDGILYGRLGHRIKIPKKPMLCPLKQCPCLFDVYKVNPFSHGSK